MIRTILTLATLITLSATAAEAQSNRHIPADGSVDSTRYISPHGPLSSETDCSSCHDSEGWSVGRAPYDHSRGEFPLEGRHGTVQCAACHLDLRFDGPRIEANDCASCHADVHQGSLGVDCASCHDTRTFATRGEPDVHARTSFPLTGSHLLVHCESCHFDDRRPRFDALDTDCYSCHRPDFERSTAIDHVGQALSTDCLECHNTVAWFNRARVPPGPSGHR